MLERLQREAMGGDVDAARELLRQMERAGLEAPALRRALAWVLVQDGEELRCWQRTPLISVNQDCWLEYAVAGIPLVALSVQGHRIPVLWDNARASGFILCCVGLVAGIPSGNAWNKHPSHSEEHAIKYSNMVHRIYSSACVFPNSRMVPQVEALRRSNRAAMAAINACAFWAMACDGKDRSLAEVAPRTRLTRELTRILLGAGTHETKPNATHQEVRP